MTKRILVVSDDVTVCESLREIFASRHWEVTTAPTPADARRCLVEQTFDLVVIGDCDLQAAAAFDLFKEFRGHCPVVLAAGLGTCGATTADALGVLAEESTRMDAVTEAAERQQPLVEARVAEATTEYSIRNTQLETLNRELWEMTRRLTDMERLAAAGQTAAQLAHEVGTPLNLISGHVQLLSADLDGNAKAQSRLEIIGVQIERIERIVRAMLDRTRPDATEYRILDLNKVLKRTFDVIQPAMEARNIRLVTQMSDLPLLAQGDRDKFQQVFINIFNNALDAMPQGGQLTVVSARRGVEGTDREQLVIEVSDTGHGMPEEVRARIFEPFFTTKPRGSGTGLGLVVARQIILEHRGDITVTSQPGCGTTVTITLPLE